MLATGYVVGVLEWACMQVVMPHLEPGQITFGTHVDVSHEAPTPPGAFVTVGATLEEIDGRALIFTVVAQDEAATVARGTHRRAIVSRARFDERLAPRAAALAEYDR